jgi:rfaE bifunctional protein nucleotidyltransferase chain/domain
MQPRSKEDILADIAQHRAAGRKIVFTNGCFDILHIGHIRYLEEARALGDYLVVGVNSDASVTALKGPSRPVNSELDRVEMLCALKSVDGAIIFAEMDPYNLISEVQPDILVKGGDWKVSEIIGADIVLARGGEVRSLVLIEGRSTTNTIQKIQRGV